jgi:hypothetical protein
MPDTAARLIEAVAPVLRSDARIFARGWVSCPGRGAARLRCSAEPGPTHVNCSMDPGFSSALRRKP